MMIVPSFKHKAVVVVVVVVLVVTASRSAGGTDRDTKGIASLLANHTLLSKTILQSGAWEQSKSPRMAQVASSR